VLATGETPATRIILARKPVAHDTNQRITHAGIKYSAVGLASWYGEDFHGRPTANGETFNMNSLSAAHPSLPLPCKVRVTNLLNHRSIVVRVNDRGPYIDGRVIDVSAKTAWALGFYDDGLSKVKVEYVGRAK
jgi:rare lipoprotein A